LVGARHIVHVSRIRVNLERQYKHKVKGKVSVHAMKVQRGSSFLTSTTDEDDGSTLRPSRFTLRGKELQYPSNRRQGGLQRRSGRFENEKNLSSL
jgi:hypothetical protein